MGGVSQDERIFDVQVIVWFRICGNHVWGFGRNLFHVDLWLVCPQLILLADDYGDTFALNKIFSELRALKVFNYNLCGCHKSLMSLFGSKSSQ